MFEIVKKELPCSFDEFGQTDRVEFVWEEFFKDRKEEISDEEDVVTLKVFNQIMTKFQSVLSTELEKIQFEDVTFEQPSTKPRIYDSNHHYVRPEDRPKVS